MLGQWQVRKLSLQVKPCYWLKLHEADEPTPICVQTSICTAPVQAEIGKIVHTTICENRSSEPIP